MAISGRLIGVALAAVLGLSAPASPSQFHMRFAHDASIVWDGAGDVSTSNNFVSGETYTRLVSEIGLPASWMLTASYFDPELGVPLTIEHLGLFITLDQGTCACPTLGQAFHASPFRDPDGRLSGTGPDPAEVPEDQEPSDVHWNVRNVLYTTLLDGPPVQLQPGETRVFQISPADVNALNLLMNIYSPGLMRVGLAAATRTSGPNGEYLEFPDIAQLNLELDGDGPVEMPEPAAVMLMVLGAALHHLRRRHLGV